MLRKTARKAIYIAKLIYTPLSIVFIFYFTWANRALLLKMINLADLQLIMLAVLSWSTLHLISPLLTKIIFRMLNFNFSYSCLTGIYISRLPARYLPGGIWHTVGRFADYRQHGIDKKQLTLLAIIETLLPALITFLMGGGYLWISGTTSFIKSMEGVLAVTSFFLLLTGPFLLKHKAREWPEKKYLYYFLLIFVSGFFWLIASISFIFYYSSLSFNLHENSYVAIAATYIFSWGIGYISIFAPQGIGIFELVAGKLLPLPMDLGGAVAFLAGFRIVVLLADCLIWGIYKCFSLYIVRSRRLDTLNPNKHRPI